MDVHRVKNKNKSWYFTIVMLDDGVKDKMFSNGHRLVTCQHVLMSLCVRQSFLKPAAGFKSSQILRTLIQV